MKTITRPLTKMKTKRIYTHKVVAVFAHSKYERWDVISRHTSYEAAEKAIARRGWDTFVDIKWIND